MNDSIVISNAATMNTTQNGASRLSSGNLAGKKVLLIDDDPDLLSLTSRVFKGVGAQVIVASDGLEGISKLLTQHPNLIILDVIMPGINGYELCKKIRKISNTPLILLTALKADHELLKGLEAGADDFLSKPFSADILLARARALLRRSTNGITNTHNTKYSDGYLEIDEERHYVQVNGERIKLTPIEFRLLVYLERHAGKVLTYEQILENVWGSEYQGSTDFVHVYISYLRSKIEQNPKEPRYICSIHGVGYTFEKQSPVSKTR